MIPRPSRPQPLVMTSDHSTAQSPGLKPSLKKPFEGAAGGTLPVWSSHPTTHLPWLGSLCLVPSTEGGMRLQEHYHLMLKEGGEQQFCSAFQQTELSTFPFPWWFCLSMPLPPAERWLGATQAWAGRVNPPALKHRWSRGRLSFFKSTIVVQFPSGTDSLALDWLSLLADYLWKKPFTLVNVKVSSNRPCHQSLWQKVREKLPSNGQRQTQPRLT